jgi:hypothetical protein
MEQDGNAKVDQSTNVWDALSVPLFRFGNRMAPQVPDRSTEYVFGAGGQGFPISRCIQTRLLHPANAPMSRKEWKGQDAMIGSGQ